MREKSAQKHLSVAVIAVVIFMAYGGGISNGFHWDDVHAILQNPSVRSLRTALASFPEPGAFSAYRFGMLRPLTVLSYAVNYGLGRFDPAGWHLFNMLAHFAACVALFGVAARLLGRAGFDERQRLFGGLAASLVFAAHPVQSEALNYFSARSALLAGAFCLGALYSYLRFRENGAGSWLAAGLLLFAGGLLSREEAAVFPAIAAAAELITPKPGETSRRQAVFHTWPWWALLAAYMLFRKAALGAFTAERFVRGPLEQFGASTWAVGLYHRLLLLPTGLNVHHLGPEEFHGSPTFWFGALLMVIELAAAGLCIRRGKTLPALAIVLFYLGLLPALAIPLNLPAAEHRTYLAMAGPGFLVGTIAAMIADRRPRQAIAGLLALTLAMAAFTRIDGHRWRDEISLWKDAVETDPHDPEAWMLYGKAQKDAGRPRAALEAYKRSIRIKPGGAAYNNLAVACGILGDRKCELGALRNALLLEPRNAFAHMNLGIKLMEENNVAGAEKHLRKAVEILPAFPEAHRNLAVVLLSKNPPEKGEALRHIITSLELDPYQERAGELENAIRRLRRELGEKRNGGGGKAEK